MLSSLLTIVPWALFAVMVLFGTIFSIIAWRGTRRASAAEDEAARAKAALAQMEARAKAAEERITAAEQRASLAEGRIAQAEADALKAQDAARQAEMRANDAAKQANSALAEARRADSQLQHRKADADDKSRKAEQRSRSLLDWARQQWESRREPDRQRAQAVQGSFQAQLEAYLDYRRAPITFRVESEVDRLAAPMMPGHATSENVQVEGQEIRVEFPVDPSLGFRA